MTTAEIRKNSAAAKKIPCVLSAEKKNAALNYMADALKESADEILKENALDLQAAKGSVSLVMLDRLAL